MSQALHFHEQARKRREEKPPPPEPRFQRVGESHYRLRADPPMEIQLDIDRLSREKHELVGELVVRCELPEARTIEGVLFTGNFNLSSQQTRGRLGKHLRERSRSRDDVDWDGLLEELVMRTIAAEREGQPARLLHTYEQTSPDDTFDVAGLQILKRHPSMLFGDGGTFKSYLALHISGLLAQRGTKVMFADWELTGEDHRDRLERLFGPEMPPVLYVRCERAMTNECDRLRRLVVEHHVDYIVCDSVAFAANGAPESAEVAADYFRAVRQLGLIGSLHVAHVTKSRDDDGDKGAHKPFGSVFWHNSARATWYVKRADDSGDDGRIALGVYNRKANLGPIRQPVGLEIAFDADRTHISSLDIANIADLNQGVSISRRIIAALRLAGGPRAIHELAEELEEKPDSIKKALTRGARSTVPVFACITRTVDGIHRWALAGRDMSPRVEGRVPGEDDDE